MGGMGKWASGCQRGEGNVVKVIDLWRWVELKWEGGGWMHKDEGEADKKG